MTIISVFHFLGVTYAAKGYFDALVKMGELASESQGSKELGKSSNLMLSGLKVANSAKMKKSTKM